MKISVAHITESGDDIRIESGEWPDVENCKKDIRAAIRGFGKSSIIWSDISLMLQED